MSDQGALAAAAVEQLGGLLLSDRDPRSPVGFSGSGARPDAQRSFGEWRSDVIRLHAQLQRMAAAAPMSGARFALYDEDPYAFSVGLFALWHAGCVAVLPPNAQPGTLERLRDAVEGAVGSTEPWLPGRSCVLVDPFGAARTADEAMDASRSAEGTAGLHPLAATAPALELFTSGTTGEGKAVPKALGHLDDEVRGLEIAFGAGLGAVPVFATASHQHLYGLLFRVLWPLAAGRPFCVDRVLLGEELFPRLDTNAVLASVPAHLDRLAEPALRRAAASAGARLQLFSSGGPLSAATAHAWERATGDAPVEVFGSTETGGVAWRRQRAADGDVPWTPFEGVRIEAVAAEAGSEGRLHVHSPYVSTGDDGFAMGDRVKLHADGRFELRGRADRVLKVGEKRLSLPDMESRLRTHPAVAQVALVGIEPAGQTRVGAVVVLTVAGRERLDTAGRRALGRELAVHLGRDFDRVLIPRAWRYVEGMPEDAQGKVTVPALRGLFPAAPEVEPSTDARGQRAAVDTADAAGARPTRPSVLTEQRGDGFVERRCRVPADLAQLDGHFPGAPIVAGVVQLGWAADLARELVSNADAPERIEALKFSAPLVPGTEFVLRVELDDARARGDRRQIRFRLFSAAAEFSSGRLRLRPAPSGAGS